MANTPGTEQVSLLQDTSTASSRSLRVQTRRTESHNYFTSQARLEPTTSNLDSSHSSETLLPGQHQNDHEDVGHSLRRDNVTYGTLSEDSGRPRSSGSAASTSSSDSHTTIDSSPVITRNYSHLRSMSNFKISHNEHRIQPPDLLRGLLLILQSLDTAALATYAYPLSLAIVPEADHQIVKQWNSVIPWVLRSLTQFCAPGFMFLVGLGVVYFARSRAQSDWGRWKFIRYFVTRAVLFAIINVLLSFIITGVRSRIVNTILLSLAINYLLVGLLYLLITFTEQHMTSSMLQPLITLENEEQARESLLRRGYSFTSEPDSSQIASRSQRNLARTMAFYFHNTLLLAGAGLLFYIPIYTSPNNGHCSSTKIDWPHTSASFRTFLLYPMKTKHFSSPFPPIPYLPYAILGLLYTRIVLPRKTAPKQKPPNILRPGPSPLGFSAGAGKKKPAFWNRSPRRLSLFNLIIGLGFGTLFVLTRFYHFGNLSEDCLQVSSQSNTANRNQYLQDFRSFFYTTSYPPSPSHGFLCLSILALVLSLLAFVPAPIAAIRERGTRVPAKTMQMFGQTSLFFFTLHIPIYVMLSMLAKVLVGREREWPNDAVGAGSWIFSRLHEMENEDGKPTVEHGIKVVSVNAQTFVVVWIVGLIIMWFACRRYSKFRYGKDAESWWRY